MASFMDTASSCAPMVDALPLAAIVRLESDFDPLAIRVHSAAQMPRPPETKEAAVSAAQQLLAQGAEFTVGLGGLSVAVGRAHGLGLDEMFNACRNLAVTGTLFADYLRVSEKGGSEGALGAAFARYFGQGDEEAGYLAGYDQRALAAMSELRPQLSQLPLTVGSNAVSPDPALPEPARPVVRKSLAVPPPSAPSWDVYGHSGGARSQVLIFTP